MLCQSPKKLALKNYLAKVYPGELLEIYLSCWEKYGLHANVASKMKVIMRDIPDRKEKTIAFAEKIIITIFGKSRRPAMIEELDKVLK